MSEGVSEAALRACGATALAPGRFPHPLAHVPDAPRILYQRGRALDLRPRVAVVGARRCSRSGREIAFEIGRGLAAAGAVVVSGAARGIDTAAHEGALSEGGWTTAVLGSGIDVWYPASNRGLFERILDTGTILSEYPPGEPAYPGRFPERNRIIAGISRAVVLIEGTERSGTLSTTRHALGAGIPVFAIPGAVDDPLSAVPLGAIRDGATMIRGVEDLLADLGLEDRRAHPEAPDLGPREAGALGALKGATLPEAVAAALGCNIPEAVTVLMGLELQGLVRSIGGRYERTLAGNACLPTGV